MLPPTVADNPVCPAPSFAGSSKTEQLHTQAIEMPFASNIVWCGILMFPQWNPLINPLQTVHRKQLLLCFGAMLFWTPGITN